MTKHKLSIDDDKAPPLNDIIVAAENGDLKGVDQALEESSFAITFRERATGMTALHVAAGNGNLQMVKHLLSKPGVDPKMTDKFGRDSLDLAIAIGHKETIETISRTLYPKCFIDDSVTGSKIILISKQFD